MFELFLIGIGFLLVVLGIILPFTPVASFIPIPILGDVLDFALAPVVILIGVLMIVIGGLLGGIAYFISQFWYIIPLGFLIWFGIIIFMRWTKSVIGGR